MSPYDFSQSQFCYLFKLVRLLDIFHLHLLPSLCVSNSPSLLSSLCILEISTFSDSKHKCSFVSIFLETFLLFTCSVYGIFSVEPNPSCFSSVRKLSSIPCYSGEFILHRSSCCTLVFNEFFPFLNTFGRHLPLFQCDFGFVCYIFRCNTSQVVKFCFIPTSLIRSWHLVLRPLLTF